MENLVNSYPSGLFWHNKRVLITGITGFKGAWASLWLLKLGAKVCGVSLKPKEDKNLYSQLGLSKLLESHYFDLADDCQLTSTFQQFQPEIVIHMAAQAIVRKSYENPIETVKTNVLGTANVLEAARHTETVRAIINVTTDKCYKNKEWIWGYREHEELGGDDLYSASKSCSELITEAYKKSFFESQGIAISTVRAGNVIGGGDWSVDRLVPDILTALSTGSVLEIRNPRSVRPWQHVLEPISGYLLLAEKLYYEPKIFSGAWNFGPDDIDCRSVEWIVNQMIELWGGKNSWRRQNGKHPHEASFLKVDNTKARMELGWRPQYSLCQSLIHIVDWHKQFMLDESIFQICEQQITDYSSSIIPKYEYASNK